MYWELLVLDFFVLGCRLLSSLSWVSVHHHLALLSHTWISAAIRGSKAASFFFFFNSAWVLHKSYSISVSDFVLSTSLDIFAVCVLFFKVALFVFCQCPDFCLFVCFFSALLDSFSACFLFQMGFHHFLIVFVYLYSFSSRVVYVVIAFVLSFDLDLIS